MKRTEFEEDVVSWGDLINFCYDEGCYICDDVYSEEARDEFINNDLLRMARNAESWEDLRDDLDSIPTGYDYYISLLNGSDWGGADDYDFDSHKDAVLTWGDEEDIWDDEDEEEEPAENEEELTDGDDENDDSDSDLMPLDELFTGCVHEMANVVRDEEQKEIREGLELADAFDKLMEVFDL